MTVTNKLNLMSDKKNTFVLAVAYTNGPESEVLLMLLEIYPHHVVGVAQARDVADEFVTKSVSGFASVAFGGVCLDVIESLPVYLDGVLEMPSPEEYLVLPEDFDYERFYQACLDEDLRVPTECHRIEVYNQDPRGAVVFTGSSKHSSQDFESVDVGPVFDDYEN